MGWVGPVIARGANVSDERSLGGSQLVDTMIKYLIFVDTNILLGFYRRSHESGLTLLKEFDKIHSRLITTYQVEMEFKRNRQAVILESLRNLKRPETVESATFLAETRVVESLNKTLTAANRKISRLQDRLKKVLADPTRNDPVYQVAQRLFTNDTDLNLNRNKTVRQVIKRRAFRRFILGYPPRKAADTSMGDALNWEWIIHVAKESGDHVIIVSRDSDYGRELDGQAFLNDFLAQEFHDRVSKKRKCKLFTKLAAAYKTAGLKVSKEAEREEAEDLARKQEHILPGMWPEIGASGGFGRYEDSDVGFSHKLARAYLQTTPNGLTVEQLASLIGMPVFPTAKLLEALRESGKVTSDGARFKWVSPTSPGSLEPPNLKE